MQLDYRENAPEKCVTSLKKSGKLAVALVCVAVGVALLFLGNRRTEEKADLVPPSPTITDTKAAEDYRLALERRIADICAEVSGAGAVSVVVTLDGGFSTVYATDKKVTVGGESTTYVTLGSGDDKTLVPLGERPPAITGVGIVCAGGGDATVRRELTALVSAAFGVPTGKIYVAARK